MIKEISCSMNDENIYGVAYIPDNVEGKIPTVILSHGLSLNHTFMTAYAEKLLDYGIASYLFDFRGGGYDSRSDGEISDMSIQSEVDDLNCVIDMVKSLDFADNSRLYLGGHSQGGLVSSLVAARRLSDICGLFLFAPAYVIPDDVTDLSNMREMNVLNLMPEYLGKTYIDSARSINLYDDITGFTKPVFIFHGRLDKRVPVRYAVEADEAYSNSTLIIFDDEEHRFTDRTKDTVVAKINEVIKDDV